MIGKFQHNISNKWLATGLGYWYFGCVAQIRLGVRDGEFTLLIYRLDYYVREVCLYRFFSHGIMNVEFCHVSCILRSALPMVNTHVAAGIIIISLNFVKILIDTNWHNNNEGSFLITVVLQIQKFWIILESSEICLGI